MSNPDAALEWTGERLVTTCHRPLVFEHLHRYAIACALAESKRVLDIACGEGYGANLLAQRAAEVVGVDIDERTIEHARGKYRHRNLKFAVGDCSQIPCADGSIDLVTSFETIEHIDDHEQFIAELKRVLAPGGILVISSPDKAEYRAVSGGANLFHQVELTHAEFVQLMKRKFAHCLAGRQRLVVGSWVGPDEPSDRLAAATFEGDFNRIAVQPGVARGVYSIAVCSDAPLPSVSFGVFEDARLTAETWHLLDREETPRQIEEQWSGAGEGHDGMARLHPETAERNRQIEILQAAAEEAKRQQIAAREAFEEKSRHVALLQEQLGEKTNQTAHYKDENERLTRLLDRLQLEAKLTNEKLARAAYELGEARWELLTLRGNSLGGDYSNGADSVTLETQNRADIAEAERDTLRGMVHRLQTELDRTHSTLETTKKKLQQLRDRVDSLLKDSAQRLVLPFSSPQRKLRRLMQSWNGR